MSTSHVVSSFTLHLRAESPAPAQLFSPSLSLGLGTVVSAQDLDRDNFMSAQEALDYGLVDKIVKLYKGPNRSEDP